LNGIFEESAKDKLSPKVADATQDENSFGQGLPRVKEVLIVCIHGMRIVLVVTDFTYGRPTSIEG